MRPIEEEILQAMILVVKAEDSQLSGCGFKPRRRTLDGVSKASYYIGKRNKGSRMGHTKKIFKKKKKTPNRPAIFG